MTINVNPPPQLRMPREFLQNNEVRAYMSQVETILFQLFNNANVDDGNIDKALNIANQSVSQYGLWLQQQIDGLPELTCDSTGFTADNTNITADMRTV